MATGVVCDRSRLLRFVVGPGDEIVPDIAARLPGRGLWLTPQRDIVDEAARKRLFSRAARRPVTVPPALADRLEALLAQRCIDTIGLARRSGHAVAGFERVAEAARGGKIAALVAALEGAAGGRSRLRALERRAPLVCVLAADELGAAFGRDRAVNAALGPGPLCGRLVSDARKLAGFRAGAMVEPGMNPVLSASKRRNGTVLERDDRRD